MFYRRTFSFTLCSNFNAQNSLLSYVATSIFTIFAHCSKGRVYSVLNYFYLNLFYFYCCMHVCLFENKPVADNVPKSFSSPGNCKEQTLWPFGGGFEIPDKFKPISLKLGSFGHLLNATHVFPSYCLWNLANCK